jgi:NAD(P)-dependent dehydrogenase (short-subunit alcohol dehydrogenase family)
MKTEGVAAIVTGGGSGLGAATARALAEAGAKVTVVDIDLPKAEAVAGEIGGFAASCDVSSEAAADAIAGAEARHGVARILVNCAGIGPAGRVVGRDGPLPLDVFTRVLTVNLIGTFNMIRLVAARLIKAEPLGDERGVFVNTASIAAFEGQIGQVAYSASKGGVVGMTLPVARDLAQHGVRVNTIAPGIFLTPLLMTVSEEFRASLGAQVPFPSRLGDPAEFAALVMHIVQNPMLNGETIRLDGAIRMGPR